MSALDLSITVFLFVVMGVLGLLSVISYHRRKFRGEFDKDK